MRKSRLSKAKQDRLIEHFVAGTTSRTASVLVGVNKNTAAYYFQRLRKLIHKSVEDNSCIRPIEAGRQGLHKDNTRCQIRYSHANNEATNTS